MVLLLASIPIEIDEALLIKFLRFEAWMTEESMAREAL